MPREDIEEFHSSLRKLRENSGNEEKEFMFATELKFARYISDKKILEKIGYVTSLWGVH